MAALTVTRHKPNIHTVLYSKLPHFPKKLGTFRFLTIAQICTRCKRGVFVDGGRFLLARNPGYRRPPPPAPGKYFRRVAAGGGAVTNDTPTSDMTAPAKIVAAGSMSRNR